MTQMLVRFALPWLIFGAALYALYSAIWRGESTLSFTPAEEIVRQAPVARAPVQSSFVTATNSHRPVAESRSQSPSGSAAATTDAQDISLTDGGISLRIENAPLHAVLNEITKQSGIAFRVSEQIGAASVSSNIRHMPLVEGLAALLRNFDVLFFFAADRREPNPQTVWVYPKGRGQTLPVDARNTPANTNPSVVQDPQIVANNIHAALQDRDPNVRYRALAESSSQGVSVPSQTLRQMAMSDNDSAVRILAMSLFAQDPEMNVGEIKAMAEAGLRDGDVTVNAHARELLEQIENAARSNDEAPQPLPPDSE